MIQEGKKKYPQLNLFVDDYCSNMNLIKKKFKNQKIDGFMFYQTFHHYNSDQIHQILPNIKKFLRKKGKIIIIDTFSPKNSKIIFNIIKFFYAKLSFRNLFGEKEYNNFSRKFFIDIMEKNNFKLINEVTPLERKYLFFISEPMVFELK